MTAVASRGARTRRGGRRPGWALLTTLLVLAIGASSALVFTNQVELLKLAVILALWAAIVAAFASVLYRRQSDVDQARVRDLKLVYDLQLDREISARREYELAVESQLRRELAVELREQAADEVAALRAELSALRTNLEILFDTDLGNRPALEADRTAVRAYADWARDGDDGPRARRERAVAPPIVSRDAIDTIAQTVENRIIDVPEVGVPPAGTPPPAPPPPAPPPPVPPAQASEAPGRHARAYRGSHRQAPDPDGAARPPTDQTRRQPPPESRPAAAHWRPVSAAEGEWLPPGTPGSNWAAEVPGEDRPAARSGRPEPAVPADTAGGGGRHSRPVEPDTARRRARHSAEPDPSAFTVTTQPPEPAATGRRSADIAGSDTGSPAGTESAASLLARLQAERTPRRRRRRED